MDYDWDFIPEGLTLVFGWANQFEWKGGKFTAVNAYLCRNGGRWEFRHKSTGDLQFTKQGPSPLGQWDGGRSSPTFTLLEEGSAFERFRAKRPLQLFARQVASGGFIVEVVDMGGHHVAEVPVQADSTWSFLKSQMPSDGMFFCDAEDLMDTPDEAELQHTALSTAFGCAEEDCEEDAPTETLIQHTAVFTVSGCADEDSEEDVPAETLASDGLSSVFSAGCVLPLATD